MFSDRLVNDDDRGWFQNLMKEKMKSEFNAEFENVVTQLPVIFGDFLSAPVGDSRPYQEIADHEKVNSN